MAFRRGWSSARRTRYKGVMYASKAEARYAARLDLLKRAGAIKGWERQVRVPLRVNGKLVCTIVPDFKVWDSKGWWYVETKGFATAVWKLKRKLLQAIHPDVDYRVVAAKDA